MSKHRFTAPAARALPIERALDSSRAAERLPVAGARGPVTRTEGDLLRDVVEAMLSAPDDAYWARRLLDLVRDPATAERWCSEIVIAVARWAAHDPSFFVHERYLSEQLAVWAWPRELLEELETALDLPDDSLRHLVLGRLWLEARRPPEDVPDFYARAAGHLRQVEPWLQVGAWHEAMCEALGVADPDELAERAAALLDGAAPASRDRAILAILRGAARAGNWALYDAHRRAYGPLDRQSSHSELARLDGRRAEQHLVARSTLPSFTRVRSAQAKSVEIRTVRPPSRLR